MIALIGDIHGDFGALHSVVQRVPIGATIIQVGDFGFWPGFRKRYTAEGLPPIYFIEGNHDHVPYVHEHGNSWDGLTYLPRGTVHEFSGSRILFLGGATSIDRHWRERRVGMHPWFEEEDVTASDIERALKAADNKPLDLVVTHAAPASVVQAHFPWAHAQAFFNPPPDWRDVSSTRVEELWDALGKPPLVCGHMHRSVIEGSARILDINELYILD